MPEPKAFEAIEELPTPRQRLRAWVEPSRAVLARTSPIHAVIRGAADKEPFAAELRATLLKARLANPNAAHAGQYLGGALRPGLTYDDAAERHCALTSPSSTTYSPRTPMEPATSHRMALRHPRTRTPRTLNSPGQPSRERFSPASLMGRDYPPTRYLPSDCQCSLSPR